VIATVYKDKFELVNTNMVNIPRHIRWLVWFFDADSSPYPFDSSWVRYSVGSGVDLVVGDIKAVPALRWGPFEFTSSAEDVKTPVFDGTITRRSK
jgi:hypothetical protein